MKKLVIGLFVLGLTSLNYAQNENSKIELVELDDVVLSKENMVYLNSVRDNTMSNYVKNLEIKAATFNVTELNEFDGRDQAFQTKFEESKGFIIATYDNKGNILSTFEKFDDVKLPRPVIISVIKKFPNWKFSKNTYLVSYNCEKGAKKIYKLQIQKNRLSKNLKIDSSGNII